MTENLTANGFLAKKDPVPIEIAEANIAPYSMPQEAFTFKPDDAALMSRFKNNDKERKIHTNIELAKEELDNLKAVQAEASKQGKVYYVSITVMATRYISYARGNVEKAIKLMDETQGWRTEYFGKAPIRDADVIDDLSKGILYFSGRDFSLRPILVVRAVRVPKEWDKDGTGVSRLIKMLVFCMEYLRRYMFLPGIVENIVVIIDLKDLGASQVPVSALKSIYGVLSHHYIVRVFKFYMVNMSWLLKRVTNLVEPILSDRQRQKLNFLDNANQCAQMCAAHQLEKDFGGSADNYTTFFPFPLLPGPFGQGYTGGERSDAVPNCHKALTPEGFRGHIWDASKTAQENAQHEYTEEAEEIFTKCKIPIPPNCPRKPPPSAEQPQEQAPAPDEPKQEEAPVPAAAEEPKPSTADSQQPEATETTGAMENTTTQATTGGEQGASSMKVNPSEANKENENVPETGEDKGGNPPANKPCCCIIS
jgi:hypothetical protein